MAKSRGRKRKAKLRSDSKPRLLSSTTRIEQSHTSVLQRYRQKWWFRAGQVIFSIAAGLWGLSVAVTGIWGPPWPVSPEIHPHEALNGSSFVLPFTIQNKSSLFDITDAEMTCGVDWVFFIDSRGNTAVFTDAGFANGTYSIPAGGTINYPCDAHELVKVQPNGSLVLRNMPLGLPSPLFPPLQIEKMCVWIGGDYKIAGLLPWRFTSSIFQWPAAPGVAASLFAVVPH